MRYTEPPFIIPDALFSARVVAEMQLRDTNLLIGAPARWVREAPGGSSALNCVANALVPVQAAGYQMCAAKVAVTMITCGDFTCRNYMHRIRSLARLITPCCIAMPEDAAIQRRVGSRGIGGRNGYTARIASGAGRYRPATRGCIVSRRASASLAGGPRPCRCNPIGGSRNAGRGFNNECAKHTTVTICRRRCYA